MVQGERILYPCYFNAAYSRAEGRRVPRSLGAKAPVPCRYRTCADDASASPSGSRRTITRRTGSGARAGLSSHGPRAKRSSCEKLRRNWRRNDDRTLRSPHPHDPLRWRDAPDRAHPQDGGTGLYHGRNNRSRGRIQYPSRSSQHSARSANLPIFSA